MLFIIKAHKYACINSQVDKLDKIQMGHDAEKTMMKELKAKKAPAGDALDMVSKTHGIKLTVYHSDISPKYRKIIMNKNSATKALNSCKKKGLKPMQVLAVAEENGAFSFYTHSNFESIHWSKMSPWKASKLVVPLKPKPKAVPKKILNVEKPRKFVAPKKRPPARTAKTGGVQFRKAEHQRVYGEHYDRYMADPKLNTAKDFKAKWRKDVSKDIKRSTEHWKASTTDLQPSGLKVKSEIMEKKITVTTRFHRGITSKQRKDVSSYANKIKDEDYLRMRAISQAYFDKNGIKELTLYRGTGGKTGEALAKKVRRLKSGDTITVVDNSLVGYSSDYTTADAFGAMEDGITVRIKFDTSDIILPDELWPAMKGADEKEYMCIGGKRGLSIADITDEALKWF